jgi:uncharacterized protein (TIGR02466 family)
MNIDHINLFPTTVGSVVDIETSEKTLLVARKILDNADNLTNTWAYRTTYGSKHHNKDTDSKDKNLLFIENYFIEHGNNFLKSLGYKPMNLQAEIFFSEMLEGDFHSRHEHANSVLSGIFYLKVPEGSSPIRFYDPRNHGKFLNLPVEEWAYTNWEYFNVQPKDGLLLVWPAWLSHEVTANNSIEGRTTCVFNLVKSI